MLLLVGAVSAGLAASGGAGSPYSFLYLLPVVLGALLLPRWPAWGLFGASVAAYLGLFWLAPGELHHHGPEAVRAHVLGMFAGFTVTALVVTATVTWVRGARIQAERRLSEARELEERTRRVSALATLAAGAAHELASPLNTILVVSKELEHQIPEQSEDLGLIGEEVRRCQEVLHQLSLQAGQGMGEVWVEQDLAELVEDALRGVENLAQGRALVPPRLVGQILRRLVGNARDAGATRIELRSELGEELRVSVVDDGHGMDAGELARACEPFYSGRAEGRGLGLYFSCSAAEQLGGRLELESTPGRGTTATLVLPRRSA